jgi:hypothetical protein
LLGPRWLNGETLVVALRIVFLQELVVETIGRQRVRNYAREPHCGRFRVLKGLLAG